MRLRMMSLALAAALPLSAPVWAAGELQGGEINFKGTVVGLPCLIETDSQVIEVDFGQIGMRDLYANTRTAGVPFTINLKDCATNVSNAVTVTFSGDVNANLPGYLAIKTVAPDNVTGIGIGFEEADGGSAILLDQASAVQQINGETVALTYNAFVEAEPQAMEGRTLTTGSFTATANYTLNYQ